VLEQGSRRGSGDPLALPFLGVFSLSFCDSLSYLLFGLSLAFCGALAFLLGALPFQFCRALPLAFCGKLSLAFCDQFSLAFCDQLVLALGGALPGLLRGAFPLSPRAFLPLGAFLFPSGGALPARGMPVTFRAGVAPQRMVRPRSEVRRCAAVRRRGAIGPDAGAVGTRDRDRLGRGQARQWRRIVICVRTAGGR
jgi:hypothetical protein